MSSPRKQPKTVGEIEGFISMLLAACENKAIYARLESLLTLPDLRRRAELNAWIKDLMAAQAPSDLVVALGCLADGKVAEKAYQVIYKCQRG